MGNNLFLTLREKYTEIIILLVILLLTVGLMAVLTGGKFLSSGSFEVMGFQMPLLGVLTLAQMLPMLTGGIDLSIISTANLSGIITALILTQRHGELVTPLAVLAGLAGAVGVGAVNGLVVSALGVSPIIGTLAMMILVRGIALAITRGYVIAGFPEDFLFLGGGTLLAIPMPFVVFILLTLTLNLVLMRTPFGVIIYMLGSNPVATMFSGINTRANLFRVYVISGFLAGVAGLIMISRFNAAQADYGASFLLLTVLISVLGGIDPTGGSGTVLGLVIAVVILQAVATGFNLVGLSQYLANALWGVILIVVIIFRRLLSGVGKRSSA